MLPEFLAVICSAEEKDRGPSLVLGVLVLALLTAAVAFGEKLPRGTVSRATGGGDTAMTHLLPCCFPHRPALSLSPLRGKASKQNENLMTFTCVEKLAFVTVPWCVTKPRGLQ